MRALEGRGPVVIEDMTLADLTLAPAAPPPLAAFTRSVTTLTVGSLSKLFWGGLRVGWIRGPEPQVGEKLTLSFLMGQVTTAKRQ